MPHQSTQDVSKARLLAKAHMAQLQIMVIFHIFIHLILRLEGCLGRNSHMREREGEREGEREREREKRRENETTILNLRVND